MPASMPVSQSAPTKHARLVAWVEEIAELTTPDRVVWVDGSKAEFDKYGRNRLAEGKLPACAEMCSTKALLGGDGDVVADIFRNRVLRRGKGSEVWGWGTAYGKAPNAGAAPPAAAPQGKKS